MIVFPEGTTSAGDCVLPFKRGIFGVARRLGVPVVPVALRYDSPSDCWIGSENFLSHYVRTVGGRRSTADPITEREADNRDRGER